jgi:glycosyltransferase involved in cell wall biosynthesis
MKVMQVMAGAEYGGAEAFYVRLVSGLHRAGRDQRAVIRTNPERAARLRAAGIEPVQMKFGGPFDLMTKVAMRAEIKRYRPDIVLSWMSRATAAVPPGKFVHVARLGGYYDAKYYQRCDHLIANTQNIADYLMKEGWTSDRIHYLRNFVLAEQAEPRSRRELFTPDHAPLILALGRLHPNKAFDILLHALARIPNAYLWLAGEGESRGELEKLAEKLSIKPRVRFLGWCDDTAPLFAAADLFVCPSRHEPLGNVVIEAWAHGVPVIASDSLGPGTLIEQGRTGILVPVDDSASLANAIRRTLEDAPLRDNLAEAGYAAYRAEYTEAAGVAAYISLFERLVA